MGTKKSKNTGGSITSMTGYGRASGELPAGRVSVEARSLNHRYLEVFIRSPKAAMYLDPEIRTLVKNRVSRGKVELFINLEGLAESVALDLEHAQRIAQALQEIAEPLGDKVRLEHILAAGEIKAANGQEMVPELAELILATTEQALENLASHRIAEGKSLAKDIAERMGVLSFTVAAIEDLAVQVTDRVRKQVGEFIDSVNLGDVADPQRLEVEIALIAQKSDIAEEITRLKTHLFAFDETLSSGGVVGRRMDFLLQEIQREVNTIGSKSGVKDISGLVVDFKTELEKIREQVQNIE